jgi:hypothetical protein
MFEILINARIYKIHFTNKKNNFCFDALPLLVQHLLQSLTIHHSTTTRYHLQCNSHAEGCSKTIEKYLAAFGGSLTLV